MAKVSVANQETVEAIKKDTTAIRSALAGGGVPSGGDGLTLDNVNVYMGDFVNDDLTMKNGGVNEKYHFLQT